MQLTAIQRILGLLLMPGLSACDKVKYEGLATPLNDVFNTRSSQNQDR